MNAPSPEREPNPPTTPPHPEPARQPSAIHAPHPPLDPFDLSQLIAAGDIDVVSGDPPVPITVWRVADLDARHGHAGEQLTPRLAGLLVGSYSRTGDTIVSLGHDPALHGAAGAHGCTYLSVDEPADLADLDHVAGTVRLLVLPPRTTNRATADTAAATDLFTACRTLMAADGCTIVALAALPTGVDAYPLHAPILIDAARRAGLGWLQHILAVTAPIAGDRIRWRATPADAASLRAATHVKIHVDLLVMTPRVGRRG